MAINLVTQQLGNQVSSVSNSKVSSKNSVGNDNSFQTIFNDVLNKTNSLILESEKLTKEASLGNIDNIHQVLIASEKADIALQLTLQIRNKVLDAYNDIMRMQI
ncbi:MAG TPA: flagellar hook-basal body complex protein FliE [Clostridiaceae bacterium]|nr:flagellar hook-basal body complex protein FliE [Clostridiaceae bacterium]